MKCLSGLVCAGALLTLTALATGNNSDWPQYRGPNRDGISPATGLLKSWPESGPKELWKVPIGSGFSGISVVAGKLYTGFAEGENEYLACYHADTGKELWRVSIGEKFRDTFGDGPRSSPTVDGATVYAVSSYGDLFAIDKDSGKVHWTVSFPRKFEAKTGRWGFSMSPIVDGDRVIVESAGGEGEGIAAFDKRTGAVLWTVADAGMGYSSPIVVTYGGQRQYVFITAGNQTNPSQMPPQFLVSVTPEGKVLWRQELPGSFVAMPVFAPPDKIFVSASTDDGCRVFQMKNQNGAVQIEEIWSGRTMKNHFNSSVYKDGYLYGFSNATLRCVHLATGEIKWSKRGLGKGSLLMADGMLIVLSDRGKMLLADASSERFREISVFQPLTGKSWTMPTLAGDRLYLRNLTDMVCYDIGK